MKHLKTILAVIGLLTLFIGFQSWAARKDLLTSPKLEPIISDVFLTESPTSTISIPKFKVEVKDTEYKAQGYCEVWKGSDGSYTYIFAKGGQIFSNQTGCE